MKWITIFRKREAKQPLLTPKEAYLEGYSGGHTVGFDAGYREGYNVGRAQALDEFKGAALKALNKHGEKHNG